VIEGDLEHLAADPRDHGTLRTARTGAAFNRAW
jgi:hypothetical protein